MRSRQHFQFERLTMGACYYPEHWDPALWENDLTRMLDAGISIIRIAEFAWTLMEPEEGVYDFSLFDSFLALCEKKGMKVILGTPTATPPVWLTLRYPETLNVREDGMVYRHGGRRHYNYNSPVYQEKCRQIVTRMAEHFGRRAAVAGWQIDNEINCETCEFHSDADQDAFRHFLREKYGNSLEALNDAWGTAVWSQGYSDWEQIYTPGRVINHAINPHQHLDYIRFVSDSAIRFARMQAEIIRKYKKADDFITTNGLFDRLDNHELADACLDIYSYDSYPNFAFGLDRADYFEKRGADWKNGDLDDRKWSKHLAETRSVCPHFAIMEQQAGAGSWTTRMEGPSPKPGQLVLWAMQSVAHGADLVSFFRWRTACIGTEMYWHGILDYDNRDNRRLAEVKQFGEMLEKIGDIVGAEHRAAFGILTDYDNRFDEEVDHWHGRVARASEKGLFEASQLTHRPYDLVDFRDGTDPAELRKYRILLYPHPVILTEKRAEILKEYVRDGGTLVTGARAGYKDIHGKCVMAPMPGLLSELTGTAVKEFTFAPPADPAAHIAMEPAFRHTFGEAIPMPVFYEMTEITADAAVVLARYADGQYAGAPALTSHSYGSGRCLHFGGVFSREAAVSLLKYLDAGMPFDAWGEYPEEVETVLREKDGKQVLFLLNYQPYTAEVRWKRPVISLLTGTVYDGTLWMPGYGTDVVSPQE